jgi:ketosteroid isomerase-like protein
MTASGSTSRLRPDGLRGTDGGGTAWTDCQRAGVSGERSWNRGDYEPGLSLFDPDVVYVDGVVLDSLEETYHGPEGVMKAWGRWSEPWEEITTELEEVIGGGDRLVSVHRAPAQGSGIDVDLRYADLWRFREGKVIYFESFPNREQALQAARLSE